MESINVNLNNLTQNEREQLMKLVEKGNRVMSKVWKPKHGEKYYLINSSEVTDYSWDGDGDYMDQYLYSIGNCYPTEEAAEFALERMKVLTELQRYAVEHNEGEIDWNNFRQTKYFICYEHEDKEITVDSRNYTQHNSVYFTDMGIALDAIETVGEDRIKKYMFGIED